MRQPQRLWWGMVVLAGVLLAMLYRQPRLAATLPVQAEAYTLAQVEQVTTTPDGSVSLDVRVLEGEWAGVPFRIEPGKYQPAAGAPPVHVGDRVWLTVSRTPDGFVQAYFVDVVRTPRLAVLALALVAAIVLTSGWKGVRSLLAMLYSLAVIVYYIIPAILDGADPVRVSVTGSIVLLAVTLYFTYGWTLKTHAAVLSMAVALTLTGLLAWAGVEFTRLRGYGAEEVLFLAQAAPVALNLRGLLLGGMLIGALGVLDDLVATQAAAVVELYAANPRLTWRELVQRAMHIGQDHVAATVNTLVLAYTGTALPLLLLFALGPQRWNEWFDYEFVAEEVVRTLIGALGLVLTVPLTTWIAAWLVLHRPDETSPWARWLGPLGDTGHGH